MTAYNRTKSSGAHWIVKHSSRSKTFLLGTISDSKILSCRILYKEIHQKVLIFNTLY